MNSILIIILCFSFSLFSATPFTVSGKKIQSIFKSQKIWSKISGEVKSINFLKHKNNISYYELITDEYSLKNNKNEFKILKSPFKCKISIEVKNEGDPLSPKWNVNKVDFKKCPVGPKII
mgnify:CR=1 FL=1